MRAREGRLVQTASGSLVAALLIASPAAAPGRSSQPSVMDRIAPAYVSLVLALGHHDPDYVDAYYGPPDLKTKADADKLSLDEIGRRAKALIGELGTTAPAGSPELVRLRHHYLRRQLEALAARVRMLKGETLTFDEESKALYDAVAPVTSAAHFETILAELERKLPGEGPLVDRYEGYRQTFVIPRGKLDAVFLAAIEACRARTREHIALPANERFTVEYVTGQPWSAYNWYKGGYRSVIQVNTELPIFIDRAIDLACHEGYPGHHVYNVLLEKTLVNDRGWVEFSVYALFSPQSLIAEGTANYGIEVAFPGGERVSFERQRLFPLAGLDRSKAAGYYAIQELVERLAYAGNEAARRYLNGEIDREAAVTWLMKYALMARPRAEQRVRFIERYRSYVINYNLGKDMVREHVEAPGGAANRPARRWPVFAELLASPRLPSALRRSQ
jgi:hypothetical protein